MVLRQCLHQRLEHRAGSGGHGKKAEALLIADILLMRKSIHQFRQHWHEMVSHAYEDNVALMETLIDDGRDVTMLTNFCNRYVSPRGGSSTVPQQAARRDGVSGEISLIRRTRRSINIMYNARSTCSPPRRCSSMTTYKGNVERAPKPPAGRRCRSNPDADTGRVRLQEMLRDRRVIRRLAANAQDRFNRAIAGDTTARLIRPLPAPLMCGTNSS